MNKIRIFANICILIFLYYLVYYLYNGFIHPIPGFGDSWDYHIPIANSILNGSFIFLKNVSLPTWYYPGSSEVFTALFIFFHIPLTLSNVIATIVLFLSLIKLSFVFKLKYYYGLMFAATFCTLNVIVRWLDAVSIDVWLAVFFVLAIILLENPKKSLLYFIELGFILGMIIGSKTSGILFVIVLFFVYFKKIIPVVNFKRLLLGLFVPIFLFGLFWYLRNFYMTGNPFYPVNFLWFRGPMNNHDFIAAVSLKYPLQMLNAFISEYKMWVLTIFIAAGWLISKFLHLKHIDNYGINRLFLIGVINFILYFTFPTSAQPWIMVSSLRYSYPTFIPLILGTFLLVQELKKEEFLGYLAIGNMIMVTSLSYTPKLVFLYIPAAFLVYYFIEKYKFEK